MYQPLTQDQFQSAQKAGFSTDQIIANEKTRQQNETANQGFFSKNLPGLVKPGNDIKSAFKSGLSQAGEGINRAAHAQSPLQGLEAGVKIGSGAVSSIFSPLAPVFQSVGTAINYAGDKIGSDKTVQRFANSKAGQITSRAAEDVSNLTNLAQGVAGSKYLTGEVPKFTGAVTDTLKNAPENIKSGLQDRYVNQNTKGWTEPTTVNKPGFNKATEIFDNAKNSKVNPHNIGETLTNNKLNVNDHIENGNYATADTADQLRQDAGKMSKETLRPSLQKADTFTPRTSVDEWLTSAKNKIQSDSSITAGNKVTLLKNLETEGAALKKQFPQGISLTDLHDNKITYDQNSKYSSVGDVATNNSATLNKAMADSARSLLEKNAPPEIPVKQFNGELQKQYQAANYLDALNGKKVPQSILSKFAKTTAKVTGATLGSTLGGGIFGTVGGYHIGGMIESMFEHLPNPVKNSFLRNLEQTNPAVFQQVKDFLNTHPNLKQLSAPSSIQLPQGGAEVNGGQYKSTIPNINDPQAGFADFGAVVKDIKSIFNKKPIKINSYQDSLPTSQLISHEGAPDTTTVAEYRRQLQQGKSLQPIKVIQEGNKYGIEDGKHRFEAYQQEGIKDIPVEIINKPVKINNYQNQARYTKGNNGKFTGRSLSTK